MRLIVQRLAAILFLAGCPSLHAQTTPAPTAASLVRNGDFSEAANQGQWPAGWGTYTPGNGITWETEPGGSRFLRLVTQTPGQLQMLTTTVSLPPDAGSVTVTLRYRTSNVRPGADADDTTSTLFVFRDSPGRLLPAQEAPLLLADNTPAWREASTRLVIPADATRLTILSGLCHAAAGTLDIATIAAVPDAKPSSRPTLALMPALSILPQPGEALPSGQTWQDQDGQHFFQLVSENPGQMQMLTRTVPITVSTHGLEISARFRTTGLHSGEKEWNDARTIVQFLDADGQTIPSPGGSLDLVFGHKPAPTKWIEQVRSCRVPAGAVQLRLMAGLFRAGSGTVDISYLRVRPLDDATLATLDLVGATDGRLNDERVAEREREMSQQLADQLASTGNLVTNGDFATIAPSTGWPEDWGKKPTDGHVSLESEGTGHFIRLTADPGKTVMLYHMCPLLFDLHFVDVCIRYRTTGVKPGSPPPGDARAVLHFFDGRRFGHLEFGHQLDPDPANLVLDGAPGAWHELRARIAVPDGATKLQLMPGLWNAAAGTLDIAKISLTPAGKS